MDSVVGTAGTVVAAGRGLAGASTSVDDVTGLATGVSVEVMGIAVVAVASRFTMAGGVVEVGWVPDTLSTGEFCVGNFVVTGAPQAVVTITRMKIARGILVDTGMARTYSAD